MRTCLMLAATAATLAGPGLARAESLDLVCRGVTRAYEQSASGAAVFNTRAGTPSGLAAQVRLEERPNEFRVRIDGDSGAVRPPPALVPWLTGKGAGDGWWPLTELSVSDSRIVGTYSHSLVYSPRVTIDRRTGAVSVRALVGDAFDGTCEPAATGPEPRRF